MFELAVLALLTSEFASERRGLRAIVVVIAGVSLVTAALAALGLALFYAGEHTSLIGAYGEQFVASDSYARVAAGFNSPALLASFCIFASAVVAREDSPLPARITTATQVALVRRCPAHVLPRCARVLHGDGHPRRLPPAGPRRG